MSNLLEILVGLFAVPEPFFGIRCDHFFDLGLAQAVAIKARDIGEEYATIFKNTQQELEDEITSIAQEIAQGAYALRKHLSDAEIEEMIASYTKERLWDSEQIQR